MRPRLGGLTASPGVVALLAVLLLGAGVLLQWWAQSSPAIFYWRAVNTGWLSTVLQVWVCWLVARHALRHVPPTEAPGAAGAPDAATLFGLLLMQQWLITLPLAGFYLGWARSGAELPVAMRVGLPFLMMGWVTLAGVVLLLRFSAPGVAVRAAVLVVFGAVSGLGMAAPALQYWYPAPSARSADGEADADDDRLKLTQEALEAQSAAVVQSLQALPPQRPGVTDVYAITFAPYASESVFRKESAVVADTLRSRFDAEGRVLQLINHPQTMQELPWATGLNLQRAIQKAASLMDPDEDVLFIHLTSHGARDGELATSFYPIEVEPVTPQLLRQWLDDAGVRYRVLSISACFSGSWLPALTEPGTLVMTAADAEHTSYGCGHKSELTFFGRAMYAEELRRTRSFEEAHAKAREVIAQREKEAGKTDGYSNPQIVMGEAIRPVLAALQARLDAQAP